MIERETSALLCAPPVTWANQAIERYRPILTRCLKSSFELESQRYFLKAVRDQLDDICRRFEHGDKAEEFEEIYLPLFDCLSLLNDALVCRPVYRVAVELASDRLNELHDLLAAPAAV